MFTGLVQAIGEVASFRPQAGGARLVVDAGAWTHRTALGDSVAVNGCCLTVAAEPEGTRLSFDLVPQTIDVTALGALRPGDPVNLESAATLSSLLGGHLVQGHIDQVSAVIDVTRRGAEHRVRVAMPAGLEDAVIARGSIALDGISLTIAGVDARSFSVALIPHTLEHTTAGGWRAGHALNVEFDPVARQVAEIVRRMLAGRGGFTEPGPHHA